MRFKNSGETKQTSSCVRCPSALPPLPPPTPPSSCPSRIRPRHEFLSSKSSSRPSRIQLPGFDPSSWRPSFLRLPPLLLSPESPKNSGSWLLDPNPANSAGQRARPRFRGPLGLFGRLNRRARPGNPFP
ncbi:hypothetical protein VPH35_138156 [Triticum aestivum]|uniref:Uncharacterized protein n=1 Tax=Aegilops tauschii subsp. strangulata TaxID=200361 RepID=A0A453S7I6_AEGTS